MPEQEKKYSQLSPDEKKKYHRDSTAKYRAAKKEAVSLTALDELRKKEARDREIAKIGEDTLVLRERLARDNWLIQELSELDENGRIHEQIFEDGDSNREYTQKDIESFLLEAELGCGNHTFGAWLNWMSLSEIGRLILSYYGTEALSDATWKNFTFVNHNDDKGFARVLQHVSPETQAFIDEQETKWEATRP